MIPKAVDRTPPVTMPGVPFVAWWWVYQTPAGVGVTGPNHLCRVGLN